MTIDAGVYSKDGKIGISTRYDEGLIREVKNTGQFHWDRDMKKWLVEPTYLGLNAILVVIQWSKLHRGWTWFAPEAAKSIFAEAGMLSDLEDWTC